MSKARQVSGFTLIELLIVISIMAAFAVAVGFSSPARDSFAGRESNAPGRLTKALTEDFDNARDDAILTRQRRALRPVRSGWQILAFDRSTGRWTKQKSRNWRDIGLEWTIRRQVHLPTTLAGQPPILFLPDGRVTGFSLTVRRRSETATCRHALTGEIECTDG